MLWTLLVLAVPVLYLLTFPVVEFYGDRGARHHEAVGEALEYYSRPFFFLCDMGRFGDNLFGYYVMCQEALER